MPHPKRSRALLASGSNRPGAVPVLRGYPKALRTFTELRFRLSQPHKALPPQSLQLQHPWRPTLRWRPNPQWQIRSNGHWQMNPCKSQARSSQQRSISVRFWDWEWVERLVNPRRPSKLLQPKQPRQRSHRRRNRPPLVDLLSQPRREFSQAPPAVAVRHPLLPQPRQPQRGGLRLCLQRSTILGPMTRPSVAHASRW